MEVTTRLVQPFVLGVRWRTRSLERGGYARIAAMEEMGGGRRAGAILSRHKGKTTVTSPDPNVPPTKPGELGSFKQGLEVNRGWRRYQGLSWGFRRGGATELAAGELASSASTNLYRQIF